MSFQVDVGIESKVSVFKFSVYDITKDRYVLSKRWGTIGAIERCGGVADRDSGILVDPSNIRSDILGMTKIGFQP